MFLIKPLSFVGIFPTCQLNKSSAEGVKMLHFPMFNRKISKKHRSPNYNDRINYDTPDALILHYTGMKTAKDAIARLCDPKAEVSAHYVIEESGKIHHLVNNNKRAWHAGKSQWKGVSDMNSASIGIEIVNPGHELGYRAFPEKQITALAGLCKDLMAEFDISPARVLGHSDIAITRKIDPGHLFPWEKLARDAIGLWPAPTEMDYQAGEDLILDPDALHELLNGFGYAASLPLGETVRAFHRHYYPEKFTTAADKPDEPDIATAAKLLSLIRQSHEIS